MIRRIIPPRHIPTNLMLYSMGYCCGKYSLGTHSSVDHLVIWFPYSLSIYTFAWYRRETPDETEITSLPPSVHPALQELVFACLRASPNERPSFKVICGLMDLLFLQIHLINQDYLEIMKKESNSNNNSNEVDSIQQRVLREKYDGLSEDLMEDILSFLSVQGKTISSNFHSYIFVWRNPADWLLILLFSFSRRMDASDSHMDV